MNVRCVMMHSGIPVILEYMKELTLVKNPINVSNEGKTYKGHSSLKTCERTHTGEKSCGYKEHGEAHRHSSTFQRGTK